MAGGADSIDDMDLLRHGATQALFGWVRAHYGVNASLRALVAKAGLEAGGSFIEHRNTVWRLQGSSS
jgi:hypothetical protein